MTGVTILLAALVLDAVFGEPRWLWDRVPHPVVVMGKLVSFLDDRLNRGGARRVRGVLAVLLLIGPGALVGWALSLLPVQEVIATVIVAVLLAHRSLADHVRDVRKGLEVSLDAGRAAVGLIVGRDTAAMDESAISRATIESAAENFSDGVVAPAFWFLCLGLPGIIVYKIVNTADSMIGHRTPRHEAFGWAAARLDDLLNLAPARCTGILLALTGGRARSALATMRSDAPLHRSPNAGWPEAAMAASLDVALAGPRSYGGQMTEDVFLNGSGRHQLNGSDITRALRHLWRSWLAVCVALAVVAAAGRFL